MGVFYLSCEILNPGHRGKKTAVPKILVDSGSEFTWIPADLLKKAGITVAKKDEPFQMANGNIVTRPVGYAIVRAASFETVDEVVFAQPGDLALLGARTLEGFGAVVDARRKRLVAAGPRPAAPAEGD
jgi:predicted aspartyl protease